MTVLEAFAMGVPVVASNIGSLPCIIDDNENGVLFPAGSSGKLYAKLNEIWDNQKLLEKMSITARKTIINKYSDKKNIKMLMDIYQSALKNKEQVTR